MYIYTNTLNALINYTHRYKYYAPSICKQFYPTSHKSQQMGISTLDLLYFDRTLFKTFLPAHYLGPETLDYSQTP